MYVPITSRRAGPVRWCAWGVALLGFLFAYTSILTRLVSDWSIDDNYSHGFAIVPFALYFAWEQRRRLASASVRPSAWGLAIVVAGLAVLVVGQLGAELFLARVSLLVVLAGSIVFLRGWNTLRILGFPIAFLVLMVPIPAIIFNKIAFPLQLVASRAGELILSTLGIPVLREGNLIVLARTTLEVAEACSGIRSLISLVTLGVIYGYFTDPRTSVRALVALATIPIAVVANGLRVSGTGIAAHYFGDTVAQGFFHTFSGWLVFVVSFAMLFVVVNIVLRLTPPPSGPRHIPSAVAA